MTDKQIIIDGVDVSGCSYGEIEKDIFKCSCEYNVRSASMFCKDNPNCYYKQLKAKEQEHKELKEILKEGCLHNLTLMTERRVLLQTITEIKDIAEPYEMTIKKVCGNCKKYNSNFDTCDKNINFFKRVSSKTNACEEFTYLDELVPNILAKQILQKISEVLKDE